MIYQYRSYGHDISCPKYSAQNIVKAMTLKIELEDQPNNSTPQSTILPVQNPLGSYDICLGEGFLAQSGEFIRSRATRGYATSGPAAIITNKEIAASHADPLAESLRAAGYEPSVCLLPEGEQHKTLDTVATIYDHLLAHGQDRRAPVISLSGGVIGDMAGFAAASYLRGVPFVQIPTSLLAMVDSSVGAKTGVDLPQGKNLVGAFKQPELVIIDTDVLRTLPPIEFTSGLAEVIKHGIIDAPDLFEQLGSTGPESLVNMVADAVRVKIDVVQEDPYEQGRRATLNLGHTFGHAIELVSNFRVRHGEGVAIGTVAAANMAASMGRCTPELAARIRATFEHVELPVTVSGHSADEIMAAMLHDKKRSGKTLRYIIPQGLGDVVIIDNPGTEIVRKAVESIIK